MCQKIAGLRQLEFGGGSANRGFAVAMMMINQNRPTDQCHFIIHWLVSSKTLDHQVFMFSAYSFGDCVWYFRVGQV